METTVHDVEEEDCQALKNLTDNGIITPEGPKVPIRVLDAIQTTIKEEEHFWHYRDEILSDLRQKDKEMHALRNYITTLINDAKFTHPETKNHSE